ncbi:MAG: hypothetical protein HYV03_05935 [Deltaproteobacteria bacterium]|nr:hypothetical protein [Deltaproteobacteria bacterium]
MTIGAIISQIAQTIHHLTERVDTGLRNMPAPPFRDKTEARVTQAICAMQMGPAYCTRAENPYANLVLSLFQPMAAAAAPMERSSPKGTVVEFTVADADYRLFCTGEACSLQSQRPRPAKGIGEAVAETLAAMITFGATSCIEQPEPFDPDSIEIKIKVEEGWLFCAQPGMVAEEEDCHLDQNITNKISTCVYLEHIKQCEYYSCGEVVLERSDLYYDDDKLMTFLLSSSGYGDYLFAFTGNNVWPDGKFDVDLYLKNNNDPSENHYEWDKDGVRIVINKAAWSAQVWFRQPPDLCWAVYETPCSAEAAKACGK